MTALSPSVRLKELLGAIADEARKEFGEPEYRYYKKTIIFRRGKRRDDDRFISPIGDGTEVSWEEYKDNIELSRKLRAQAFFSCTLKQDFVEYGRKMTKPGWRERLIDEVRNWPEAPNI